VYAVGDTFPQQLERQAQARYELEPNLRAFAKFPEGRGRDVLEKLGAQVVVSVRRIVLYLPKTSWSRPWSLFVLARWCGQNL
jgi:hypothetical protein